MRPFLKWAGSKKWLVRQGVAMPPKGFTRYIEPFVGSGAVFFHLLPKNSILSDANRYLVNCFLQIQSNYRDVYLAYDALFSSHSKAQYYEVRERLSNVGVEGAAQFLYLNRTCFNGVFRVNLAGKFNVPIGSKVSNPFGEGDFAGWSEVLANAKIDCCDFEETISLAKEGDFLFVDPPYTVAHNQNGFIEYNEKIFSWDDQVRLADALRRAHERGARFTLTNANHDSVRCLYEKFFDVSQVDRLSAIAGKPEKRGKISEIVVQAF